MRPVLYVWCRRSASRAAAQSSSHQAWPATSPDATSLHTPRASAPPCAMSVPEKPFGGSVISGLELVCMSVFTHSA
eukprot:1246850-Rhodomonas_salina.2